MSRGSDLEPLEALIDASLEAREAAGVTAHVDGCEECADELAWLREERAQMSRRAARTPRVSTHDLWEGIEARVAAPPPQQYRRVTVPAALMSFAAAALLLVAVL